PRSPSLFPYTTLFRSWSVIAGGVVLTAFLMWYFFGPKKSRRADVADGVQEVTVTVRGGYSPDLIEVQAGMPVRLLFDRQESGDRSEEHTSELQSRFDL